VLSIFPEAGSWAKVLRPARPGAALLASRTQALILPVGLTGLTNLFPSIRKGKRATVTIKVGKPFGPLFVSERGESDRKKLDEWGMKLCVKLLICYLPKSAVTTVMIRRSARRLLGPKFTPGQIRLNNL